MQQPGPQGSARGAGTQQGGAGCGLQAHFPQVSFSRVSVTSFLCPRDPVQAASLLLPRTNVHAAVPPAGPCPPPARFFSTAERGGREPVSAPTAAWPGGSARASLLVPQPPSPQPFPENGLCGHTRRPQQSDRQGVGETQHPHSKMCRFSQGHTCPHTCYRSLTV